SASLAEADLLRALRAAGFRGSRIDDMRIVSRTGSGRVARLQLAGLQPPEISGQDLRMAVGRTIGWQHIKSTAFDLHRQGDAYRFNGNGSGHGVGLCVIGSARLAEAGKTADEILRQDFPGLTTRTRRAPVSTAARSSSPPPSPRARSLPEHHEGAPAPNHARGL